MRLHSGCLLILFVTTAVFPCTINPPTYKVPLSFSVELQNEIGPVGGIKLQITGFSSDPNSGLTQQQRDATPQEILRLLRERQQVIAEAITDQKGQAHFALTTTGHFTLTINHPASHLDWVALDVEADAVPLSLKLQWPTTPILMVAQMRGRLSKGLLSSRSIPLKNTALKLHTIAEYKEIARATTDDKGTFAFAQVPQGLYFLEIVPSPFKTADFYKPEGSIPVYIGSHGSRESIRISTVNTSCGLSYDLEENKAKYKPEACFKGHKQVECKY
jgi:hypothetical protein